MQSDVAWLANGLLRSGKYALKERRFPKTLLGDAVRSANGQCIGRLHLGAKTR